MRKVLIILLFLLSSCSSFSKFNLYEENDFLDPFKKNSDKYYTQGLKASLSTKDNETYSVGQQIYTPLHKHLTVPLNMERPYAGYLYGQYDKRFYREEDVQDSLGMQLGLIGPHAYGQQVQGGFHRLLGQGEPSGWSHQLHDEPVINLLLEEKRRVRKGNFEAIGNFGTDLGNGSTLQRLGALFRYGRLPNDFGPVVIQPRIERSLTSINGSSDLGLFQSFYAFAGTEGRLIERNIFLDGNSFRDSASVRKEPLVADLKFGFAIDYQGYSLIYTFVAVTDEWKDAQSSQNFGSLNFGFQW